MQPDVDELVARANAAAARHWPGARVSEVEQLEGGVSSLTYSAELIYSTGSRERIVVKVAPPGLPPVRNRDVLRQARVLRRLGSAGVVPLPEVLVEDDRPPPWFAMQFLPGQSFEPAVDGTGDPPSPAVVDQRARAAARALVRMHSVDPAGIGLGEEPTVTLADELERWHRALGTVDDSIRPDEDRSLYERLVARVPEPLPSRVVHGDYRLGNMLFDGATLTAIIDWEIWTLGDPRLDLAWLVMYADYVYQPNRTHQRTEFREAAAAMPTPTELLEEYGALQPEAEAEMPWFLALSCYKTVAAVALLVKNARKRGAAPGTLPGETELPLIAAHGLEQLSW